jgi:UDP-N-acetyl-D-mannosaminuronate dehydrogenase
MVKMPLGLDQISTKLFKKVMEYGHFESKTSRNLTKVCFLGLNLNPNTDGIWNFDILYLYKAFLERGISARLHDPHIKFSEAISQGVYLGRNSEHDNWANCFDTLILSCPHMYYIKNMTQLYKLFKPNKACMLLDLYGVFSKLATMNSDTHHVDVIDFSTEYKSGDLLGGLYAQPVPRLSDGKDSKLIH